MATLNFAEHFRIDHDFGSIAPGKVADIIILEDLEDITVSKVVVNGKLYTEGS